MNLNKILIARLEMADVKIWDFNVSSLITISNK